MSDRKASKEGAFSKYTCTYGSIPLGQRIEALPILANLVNDIKPDIIVEIGFWKGGLSVFLSDLKVCDVHSFDIQDSDYDLPDLDNLHLHIKNCHTEETKEFIEDLTQNNKTLWLIDGGNKGKEFNFLSPLLKGGEVIMVHDFAPDSESFNYLKGKDIWRAWECKLSDLNLEDLDHHERFDDIWRTAIWGAFVKRI